MLPSCSERLPLAPLLHAYAGPGLPTPAELHHLPGLGRRFGAVLSATAKFLYDAFLDGAPEADWRDALARFYEAAVEPPLHADALRARAGFVRHGVAYLLRGQDAPEVKAEACLAPHGAYHVPGLGPSFWTAVLQACAPDRHPGWTPATLAGLRRLGLAGWAPGAGYKGVYAAFVGAHARARAVRPELTALHVDHFLTLVAGMRGRDLRSGAAGCPVEGAVRRERQRTPLRERLKGRGQALADGKALLEAGLAGRDGRRLGDALAAADPAGAARCPLDWGAHGEALALWVGRLWAAEDPYPVLADFWRADELPGAGLWLPTAVLHLRDPGRYLPWDEDGRLGYAALDDSADAADPPAERYRLFNGGAAWLRQRHRLHPVEVPAVLSALGRPEKEEDDAGRFGGFCADSFAFLAELSAHNSRAWMERQRGRYAFAVRAPLAELCRALAERYVGPVLRGRHGWDLDAEPRPGRALTRVCKNAYGRPGPYNNTLWIAFCTRAEGRAGAQLFVRLDATGLRYGLRLGRAARGAWARLRDNVGRHGDRLAGALRDGGAFGACTFGPADGPAAPPAGEPDLSAWAAGRSAEAARHLAPDDPLLGSDDLVGDVLLTFDRLLPAYACAVEEDAGAWLARQGTGGAGGYAEADFTRATSLGGDWLRQALGLLGLKKQLILQGVPGTGKTHVARCLARLLAGGADDAVRLVQFHPAYSYEEFVEGIKVRSVAVDGRHDVTYPVEDGLLCEFAARAAARPAQAHVLIIDELNRGNLPRVFGELLYLLEYRGQAVSLPCSRRTFRLPANLYLLATMNAADRSVALLDQALRRRFSFLEMPPDAGVLGAWLRAHPPAGGPAFAGRVLGLFERLNARLRADLGAHAQVGHSYFMVPQLDEGRLRLVWQHHVRPLLEEHFFGQPGRAEGYDLDRLLEADGRPGRSRQAAGAAGP